MKCEARDLEIIFVTEIRLLPPPWENCSRVHPIAVSCLAPRRDRRCSLLESVVTENNCEINVYYTRELVEMCHHRGSNI